MRLAVLCLLAAAAFAQPPAAPEVKAGGVALTLPAPADDFVEAGDRLRTTFFELMVPSANRLLAAYVPSAALTGSQPKAGFDVYAMVQVPRQAEYGELTADAFVEVKQSVGSAMGNFGSDKVAPFEEELNLRLKAAGAKPLEIGRPEMLGAAFDKSDSVGYLMLIAVKSGDTTKKMVGGLAALRLKQRLVFAYFYRPYESEDSVLSAKKSLESWTGALLARNQ